MVNDVLLIWDADGLPPVGDWTTVLWRQYSSSSQDPAAISIPQHVEHHSDELRARYLGWIHDLGEMRIGAKTVIDHLELRPGFSYWWMSSLAQKFNASGTSNINDILKAMVLEKILDCRQATSIVLCSKNRDLAAVVQDLCRATGLGYEWRLGQDLSSNHQSVYKSLPHLWQALIYLGWYVLKALPLLLKNKASIPPSVGENIFIDVLVHLDKRALLTNKFISNYWTTLVDKLSEWKVRTNWLHAFYRHPAIPTPDRAEHQIQCFNMSANGQQFHMLIETNLTFRMLFNALRDYFAVNGTFNRLSGIDAYRPAGSALNLWPLQAREWRDSLCGKEAISNCMRLALFEDAMNRIPTQKLGVYILENQPWEMALIYAWKAAGHKTLIGTPHTAVRYWDLRYHYDSRSYVNNKRNRLPMPDILAVNGPAAHAAMLASGYPGAHIRHVEALRFLNLSKPASDIEHKNSLRTELHVLVCADFLAATSRLMLSWLEIATRSLPDETIYVFKPHPAYLLNPRECRVINMKISEAPLAHLLADCDVVFASNSTSAAVDAYCAGLPIIQMLDANSINLSPLRGFKGVTYVTDPTQLSNALRIAKNNNLDARTPYFYLDNELPGWRNLLNRPWI